MWHLHGILVGGGIKCPYMAALTGERTQAGQVRLQAGLRSQALEAVRGTELLSP